jgi:hypothetical protein
MSVYKTNTTSETKSTNLGVQSKDPQSLIDYFSGINGQTFSFNAGEYDAVVGFFSSKGFSANSSSTLAYLIMSQAKIDNVPVFKILDTFDSLTVLQLNETVAEIINLNRYKTSVIGFKQERSTISLVERNIKV